jgi:hypothetical protein
MGTKQISLRVDKRLLARADSLVSLLLDSEALLGQRLSQASVLKRALFLGLLELERSHAPPLRGSEPGE